MLVGAGVEHESWSGADGINDEPRPSFPVPVVLGGEGERWWWERAGFSHRSTEIILNYGSAREDSAQNFFKFPENSTHAVGVDDDDDDDEQAGMTQVKR